LGRFNQKPKKWRVCTKKAGKVNTLKDAAYWLKLVSIDGLNLKKVPKEFINNELCETALKQNAWAFQYVPTELMTAKMCEKAVAKNGNLIEFVPKKLKTKAMFAAVKAFHNT
jgi:Domain of unknown function (DUF4116)